MCDVNVEITLTRLKNQKVAKRFIKLGNASLKPAMTLDEHSKNPHRFYPPTEIASREITKGAFNDVMPVTKRRFFLLAWWNHA